MKRINIGMVNFLLSKKLQESYVGGELITEVKNKINELIETIKSSPILQLEFKIYNNLENKFIENDIAATRYIDSNIKLLEVYTLKEINTEHEKLKGFINEDVEEVVDPKLDLYVAINNLITENLKNNINIDIDTIHESYMVVLNHIKYNKPKETLKNSIDFINEEVLEIAIDKFNEKYETLEEDDKNLLVKLMKSNNLEKKVMLEDYKKENLQILENVDKSNINEKVTKTIEKVNGMKYNEKTIIDDIVSLYELKKALL